MSLLIGAQGWPATALPAFFRDGSNHRLGNSYFMESVRVSIIIISEAAVADYRARLQDQLFIPGKLVGKEAMAWTEAVMSCRSLEIGV